MYCMNTLPIWHSSRDLNTGADGSMWPLYNSDRTWKSEPGFDAFPSCSMKQDQGYEKEALKQIMLKQEAIFVDQVSELHHLYKRQKELMNDIERKQLLPCQMQRQHRSSQLEPDLAENTVLSTKKLQPPSSLKWSRQLSAERKKPAKRLFDLELPADAYIDSEEGEQFEDTKVSEVREVPSLPPKRVFETPSPNDSRPFRCNGGLHAAYEGGYIRTDLLPRKHYGLFDLNGPVEVEEEETFSSNLGLMSNVDLKFQCPTFSLSLARNQETSECTNLALESSQRSKYLHLQNYPRSVSSGIRTSQQLVPPSYMVKSEPSSVVSLRKPYGNLRHIPMAVHSLPCFKTPPSLHTSSKLSVGNQRISLDKYNLNGNFAASPSVDGISSLQNNLFFKSHLESMNLEAASLEANKETDRATRMESGVSQALTFSYNFDLKRPGYSASQNSHNVFEDKSCIISPTASNNTHPNWLEEVGNLVNGPDCLVTNIGNDKRPSGFGIPIDLNSCVTENEMTLENSFPSTVTKVASEIDLEAPVSPENKEGSPPRGESEEHSLEQSLQLSKHEDKDPHGELVRVAAEAIVTLSSSSEHADNDCLLWFAGIISSMTSNRKNDLELEAYSCNVNGLKVNREDSTSFPRHQRKERTRRVRQKKDFQMGSLTCLAERDQIEPIEPTGFPAETELKKSSGRNRCSKGRRKSRKLKANEEEPCLIESCLVGWGKVNRRKRGRRVAASKPYLIFQMGAVTSS